ncbi:MAG: YihY/virulence factor BrkB family protein [Erythrobacter sp.]|uniref:YihY/virulence factor BrkB family protein n=1 Tax=Erythrobacter sp. TaxID=1042 RepID=UPI003C78479A
MTKLQSLPPRHERAVESLSPEARRERALNHRLHLARELGEEDTAQDQPGLLRRVSNRVRPGTRAFEIAKRTLVGTYSNGFMYAGNLAYLSMLAIFPFFIIGAALFELIGGREESARLIAVVLASMPPTVGEAIGPVANDVIEAREGWLLWFGAAVALWTVSSLIETIREILRRAYGTEALHAFWKYRLFSAGLILAAVVLLMVSLFAQVAIGAAQQVILAGFPQLSEAIATLRLSRILPALGLGLSLYLLFFTLTPSIYRAKTYPKWPGALFTSLWWLGVTTALPPVLRTFLTYDLTYGSLGGIIVALLFFWLVGLGLVIGAQLNAALAEPELDDSKGEEPAIAGVVQTGAQIGGGANSGRLDGR